MGRAINPAPIALTTMITLTVVFIVLVLVLDPVHGKRLRSFAAGYTTLNPFYSFTSLPLSATPLVIAIFPPVKAARSQSIAGPLPDRVPPSFAPQSRPRPHAEPDPVCAPPNP